MWPNFVKFPVHVDCGRSWVLLWTRRVEERAEKDAAWEENSKPGTDLFISDFDLATPFYSSPFIYSPLSSFITP